MDIKLIDITPFLQQGNNNKSAKQACARELYEACTGLGFFLITGYQQIVSQDALSEVFQLSKDFFHLPQDEKNTLAAVNDFNGYCPIGSENPSAYPHLDEDNGNPELGGYYEAYGMFEKTRYPQSLGINWKEKLETHYMAMNSLAHVICKIIATSLKLEENWFEDKVAKREGILLRFLHYPPMPTDEMRTGLGAHTDYGIFTILAQEDVPGLYVFSDEKWHCLPPRPNTLIVNVGNMLQRWTNDLFKSPIHRAINLSGKHRYSSPYFFDPDLAVKVECIEECKGDGPKHAPITYGAYLASLYDKTVTEHQKQLNK